MSEQIFEEDKKGEENVGEERKEASSKEGEGGSEEGSEEAGSAEVDSGETKGEADNSTGDAEAEEAEEGEAESEEKQPLRLELPKDSVLDESHVKELSELASELGLSQEQAQTWLEDRSDIVSEMLENAQEIVEKRAKEDLARASEQWKEELKSDPEVGGDNANETAELAKRFAEAYLPDELVSWLDETGYGNNPGIVKAFRKAAIDLDLAGDDMAKGGNGTSNPKNDSELFYGKSS